MTLSETSSSHGGTDDDIVVLSYDVASRVDINVAEKHTVSIFSPEGHHQHNINFVKRQFQ
jgi:hypothetical protein